MADNTSLQLRISLTIARDFARREVFPMLSNCVRLGGDVSVRSVGAIVFEIPRELAAEILADAETQYQRAFTREDRGVKKSLRHLIDDLRMKLEIERPSSAQPVAPELLIAVTKESALEVHRYGDKLLNVYGSSRQLIDAGYLPSSFAFPWPKKRGEHVGWCNWERGPVQYRLTSRRVSATSEEFADHWWLQVLDTAKAYPDNLVELYRAELGR